MIKYIITKEIEVEESCCESEQIGTFDTEEEAIRVADIIHKEMTEFERTYYEIVVWKASGDSIDISDWETFDECESVANYPAEINKISEERSHKGDYTKLFDQVAKAHFCRAPLGDGIRLWVGEDPIRYVDRVCTGTRVDLAFALADWYRQYGQVIEVDWKECFPKTNRKRYLNRLYKQGYSHEEAQEILRYLPQAVSDILPYSISKMVELWKAKAPIVEPYRTPLWKKLILKGIDDLWAERIISPAGEQARKEGWLLGRAESIIAISKNEKVSYKTAMDWLKVPEDDREPILNLIDAGLPAETDIE